METNPVSAFKNTSLYVGLVVIAIAALAAFGLFKLFQAKTTTPTASVSPSPQASPAGFGAQISPAPSPVLGAVVDQQPQTGPSFTYYVVIFSAIPAGLYLARYKRRT